ncbi:hypothetical protein C922_05260 [Plasmodium inui San Antonio 1]|uniref:Uncharacterized protein n=1 Tax=Plasmodium inui San Antonio 1 TaxID=1237626 RepID=W6ZTU7_9APIC|nr:hypothetical protein C922_05260 [Plasmodium inui San Antonio 1]EUD64357.1 hypothetical protein C922_05260 [Plasmodium inui San Antonio 1]
MTPYRPLGGKEKELNLWDLEGVGEMLTSNLSRKRKIYRMNKMKGRKSKQNMASNGPSSNSKPKKESFPRHHFLKVLGHDRLLIILGLFSKQSGLKNEFMFSYFSLESRVKHRGSLRKSAHRERMILLDR